MFLSLQQIWGKCFILRTGKPMGSALKCRVWLWTRRRAREEDNREEVLGACALLPLAQSAKQSGMEPQVGAGI